MTRGYALVLLVVVMVVELACRSVASTILDLPPPREPTPAPAAASPTAVQATPGTSAEQEPDTLRLPIELTTDPDSVLALLPRDAAGRIDWVAAIRDRVVRPRRAARPSTANTRPAEFGFDFVYRGDNPVFDAPFPHSSHTAWMDCSGCHPAIYRYRGDTVSMAVINAGKSCGVCHRSVAFPSSACYRCHVSMPASGAVEPTLTTDVVFQRDSAGAASAGSLPEGVFPHWVHRIRYACTACHPQAFAMAVGSTKLTMAAMQRGEQCGICHGTRGPAFTMLECGRCHVPQQATAPPG